MRTSICLDNIFIKLIAQNEQDRKVLTSLKDKVRKAGGYYRGFEVEEKVDELHLPIIQLDRIQIVPRGTN